jgi:hypothetical protein
MLRSTRPLSDVSWYSALGAAVVVSAALGLRIRHRRRRALLSRAPVATSMRTKIIAVPPRADSPSPPKSLAPTAQEAIADPELREYLARGRTISAIKRYRDLTGAGLREAKETIASLL